MPAADYRELVIEHLNAELAEKDAALVEALRDCDGYRLLAYASLERIAQLTLQNDSLQRRVAGVVAEIRGKSQRPSASEAAA